MNHQGHPQRIQSLDEGAVIRIWSFSEGGSAGRGAAYPATAPDAPVQLELDGRLAHDASGGVGVRPSCGCGTQRPSRRPARRASAERFLVRRGRRLPPGRRVGCGATASLARLTFWPLRQPPRDGRRGTRGPTRPGVQLRRALAGDDVVVTASFGSVPFPGTGSREPRILELPETRLWAVCLRSEGRYLFAVGNSDRAWIVPLDGSPPRRLPLYSDRPSLSRGGLAQRSARGHGLLLREGREDAPGARRRGRRAAALPATGGRTGSGDEHRIR